MTRTEGRKPTQFETVFFLKIFFASNGKNNLIFLFESGLDDPMKIENDNIKC